MEECHKEGAGIVVMDNTIFQTIFKPFVAEYRVGSVVDFCEKFEGAYWVFVNNIVAMNDLYGFRLLVMEMRKGNIVFVSANKMVPISILMLCGFFKSDRVDEAKRFFNDTLEMNFVLRNSVIDELIKNADLEEARLVFYEMSVQNIILLRTMISENDENDRRKEAKVLFEEMKDSTVVTWTSMIASCYRAGKGMNGFLDTEGTQLRN